MASGRKRRTTLPATAKARGGVVSRPVRKSDDGSELIRTSPRHRAIELLRLGRARVGACMIFVLIVHGPLLRDLSRRRLALMPSGGCVSARAAVELARILTCNEGGPGLATRIPVRTVSAGSSRRRIYDSGFSSYTAPRVAEPGFLLLHGF
ncbi:hypothetical protein WOLCODRAFT_165126 [Wolfiporia cocos MD-104 SS10]|uniref:Uncharacterized protein n=1 Tax=Wolfiporia cocos (strain MD-104) TaxID=742152 RepID=A0A2H3JQG9_WOLCO|nr:hypothetical protein WOLCODRAFT_165126 [Wolfiporia cocos MD-104 SS10]